MDNINYTRNSAFSPLTDSPVSRTENSSNTRSATPSLPKKPKSQFKGAEVLPKLRNFLAGISPFLIGLVALAQLVILFLFINPINLYQQLDVVQVLNNVSNLTSVPPTEIPVVARIGDNKPLQDIDTIRKQNEINAQVYKEAQNGDYVLGYSTNKMIIYRRSENKVLYNGDNPQQILIQTQQTIRTNLIAKTKEANLIADDSQESPELAVVVNPENLRTVNASFYANAQQNDIVATFGQSAILVLYRPSSNSIINSGKFSTNITKI